MDLDDLVEPSLAPSRVSRFAPKSSKFKPKRVSEPASSQQPQEPVPKPETESPEKKPEPEQLAVKKKEEGIDAGTKIETSAENSSVKMEAEAIPVAKEEPGAGDPMIVDEVEDRVVREIDVFFNPKMDEETQLYVLQFPLRACWRPYDMNRCEEVRLKPATAEMEIDLSLDLSDKNYDHDCDKRLKIKNQTLSCSWMPPRITGYAVGVLTDNKLHLNPIHAVVQIRPSLEHISSSGSKKNKTIKRDAEDTVKLEESSEKKPVGPSKKQIKQEMDQKTESDECWVPLKYHGSDTGFSSIYLERMVAQESSSPLQFTMSPFDYLNSLCPVSCNSNNKPKGLSKSSIMSLPLEERIKKLLCEGPVHRFSALKHYASDCTAEEVLNVLQCQAHLVQGLWTPKSSLVYEGSSKENGIHRAARDYVLILFWKSPVVSFSSLRPPQSLKNAVNKFLNIFATERSSVKDWKFKEKTDNAFMKLYPDIVKKQEELWEALEKRLKSTSGDGKSSRAMKSDSVTSKPAASLNSDRSVTKGANEVAGGKTIPDDFRETLASKVLPKVIQNHKVCSFQLICQRLRELALTKSNAPKLDTKFARAAEYVDDAPDELRKLVDQVAINIHGLYVWKSSPDPQFDSFRNVVIDLLRRSGLGAKLKKAEVFDAAKKALDREITNNEYVKVMNELCVCKGSLWTLKSGDGGPE